MAWPVVLAACIAVPAAVYLGALATFNGRRKQGEPPLVRGRLPFLGAALAFGRDAMSLLSELQREHGDVFTLFMGGRRMTFVLDPMSVPAVLKAKQLSFSPIAHEVIDLAFGIPNIDQYEVLEGLERTAKDYLKGGALGPLTGRMETQLQALVPRLVEDASQSESVDLYRFTWDLMFAAGTDALYGDGVANADLAKAFDDFDRDFPLLLARMPKFMVRDGVAGLEALVQPMADSVNPDASKRPPASAWMAERAKLMASDEYDAQFRGRAQAVVLWAAHANTIPACFWALAQLLRHPQALAAVMAEIDGSEGLAADDLGTATLDSLRMLDSAVRESLRLATGSLTLRQVVEGFVLEVPAGRFKLRAGDQVSIAPYLTHRDPEIFPEPQRYQHDRFYVDSGVKQFFKGGKRVPIPLMPFGAGVSMCPGRFFALNEIKLFVALLLSRCELELVEDAPLPSYDLGRVGLGIYPPARDVAVRVRPRPPR